MKKWCNCLADFFEKSTEVSIIEFRINPLLCTSLSGFFGVLFYNIHEDMILLTENIIRAGISCGMGDRYTKSQRSKKILYMDDNILYGWAMSQFLPWNEIKTDEIVKLEDISIISDASIIGYFVECNWSYTDNIKKTKKFPIFPLKK